jgi:hypothetical protein
MLLFDWGTFNALVGFVLCQLGNSWSSNNMGGYFTSVDVMYKIVIMA